MDNLLNTEQDSEWTVFNRQFMGDSNSYVPSVAFSIFYKVIEITQFTGEA